MPVEPLRLAAFCTYLASWLVLVVVAAASAIPRAYRQSSTGIALTLPTIGGTLLQVGAALGITLSMGDGPLRPAVWELAGVLVFAPFGAALFFWAMRSAPHDDRMLATAGAYAWLQHPIYLAFLALLAATGFLTSAGPKLLAAVAVYCLGSEWRIASEEAELAGRFPGEYADYRHRTRWRYLPGIR